MVPQVGQRIGPYEILGRLGTGGMGLVFSAWDARLQRDVAIKILRDEYATPEMRSRFLQEARAASGLNHPNICTIFDIGEQEGDPFLVMELLKGDTLRTRINAGDLQIPDLLRVGIETADALASAHARGVIHRDIKPANLILVDKPGNTFGTKVLDFGLAKMEAYGESLFDLTHTGTTVGTVAYMSPEQARGEQLDPRSDLFSLGVILYEIATGNVPFQGATSALVFVELLSKTAAPIRSVEPQFPEDLERIILKLLEKDRALRFQSAQEVVDALAELAGSSPSRVAALPKVQPRRAPSLASQPPAPLSSRQVPLAQSRPETAKADSPKPEAEKPLSRLRSLTLGGSVDPLAARTRRKRLSASGIQPAATPRADATAQESADDKFLRPVPRVVAGESSAFHRVAAEPESQTPPAPLAAAETPLPSADESAAQPIASLAPPRLVPEAAEPEYDADDPRNIAPTRPIVPQSARAAQQQPAVPSMNFARPASPRPAPRFSRIEEVEPSAVLQPPLRPLRPAPSAAPLDDSPKARMWLLPLSVLVMAIIGFAAWRFWPHATPLDSSKVIPIAFLPTNNSTGDATLGGAMDAGLALDLAQSPQFLVEDRATVDAALQTMSLQPLGTAPLEEVRRGARNMQITELLQPEIRRNGNAYTLSVRVVTVDAGAEIMHTEEIAQSREQIIDALDRLVVDLRIARGEPNDVAHTAVPLAHEATGNLDALSAYAEGADLASRAQLNEAASRFERAANADVHFTQAWLRLADLYRRQQAQVSAAAAAISAQSASTQASQRLQLLASASVALNATGNLGEVTAAAQQVLATYPHTVRARLYQSVALLEQGKFPEANAAAEGALVREPFGADALRLSVRALIADGRFGTAHSLLDRVAGSKAPSADLRLLLSWLQADATSVPDTTDAAIGRISLGTMQAQLTNAAGDRAAAHRLWQGIAAEAGTHTALFSAAGDALSRDALEMALLENCAETNATANSAAAFPLSPEARFRVGMASVLCGDSDTANTSRETLLRQFPDSFAVKTFLAPSLQAAGQWKAGDPAAGLRTLLSARQSDLISITPYLRGLMHLKAAQPHEAVTDFQLLLQHAGSTSLVEPVLYPLAQLGLARAYAAIGDHGNSAAAYARFLQMMPNLPATSPLAIEARAAR